MLKENYRSRKWSIMHLWTINVCTMCMLVRQAPQLNEEKKNPWGYCSLSNENISALHNAHLSTNTSVTTVEARGSYKLMLAEFSRTCNDVILSGESLGLNFLSNLYIKFLQTAPANSSILVSPTPGRRPTVLWHQSLFQVPERTMGFMTL